MATAARVPVPDDGVGDPVVSLPDSFVVGTASSAFQVEGALAAGGRLPSIWDEFLGARGAAAAAACDHIAHLDEDLDLLAQLGVDAYRFSISWTRAIGPDGSVNEPGLDFYRRLVDGLRTRGIAPVACLYHWDLPLAMQERGGWGSRDTAARLGDFAAAVGSRLGDGVELWATINEPFIHLLEGHMRGNHAPGLRLMDWSRQAHHLLLGHGHALAALRAEVGAGIGVIENVAPIRAAGSGDRDPRAAEVLDILHNQLTVGAVLTGTYPELLAPMLTPSIRDGDLGLISAPIDFLGVNYYGPQGVIASPPGKIPGFESGELEGLEQTSQGHTIDPDGLVETLTTLSRRYPDTLPPLIVTEIGRDTDDVLIDGTCDDADRISFLARHVDAVRRAAALGVDVRGVFAWSFLDSFEWSPELGPRYGLVHVDFATGERTPKRSYGWLAGQLAARRPGRPPAPRLGLARRS
ncbi:MAG: family 1 glycosylhydrolase [Solirubrobacteraceae bacterium]